MILFSTETVDQSRTSTPLGRMLPKRHSAKDVDSTISDAQHRNLIRSGVPQSVAQQILGHRTSSVFERYNVTDESDIKQAGTG